MNRKLQSNYKMARPIINKTKILFPKQSVSYKEAERGVHDYRQIRLPLYKINYTFMNINWDCF